MNYLSLIAGEVGISVWLFAFIIFWELVWKLIAMWKSARKGSVLWFVILALFNTIGILPILYIFVFSKIKCETLRVRKKPGRINKKSKRKRK